MKKVGKVLLGLVVFIVIVVIAVFYFTGDAVKVVEKQLKALRSGDIAAAYSYTSKEFQDATTEKEFEAFVKANPILKTNTSVSFPSREIFGSLNGTTSTLEGDLKTEDGAKTAVTFRMIKEDGKWKVLGMEVAQSGTSTTEKKSDDLTETFREDDFNYTLKYPESWIPASSPDGQAMFSPSDDITAPTVNIRAYTDDAQTLFTALKDYISNSDTYTEVKFSGEKSYTHTAKNGTDLKGKEVTLTYVYEGTEMTERLIVIPGVVSGETYAWEYFASTEQYPDGDAIANAMLASWSI